MSAVPEPGAVGPASGPRDAVLADLRARIDAVDDILAGLLEYRADLTVQVQRHKPLGGKANRDHQREAEIVARMARRAPALGAVRLQRIMHTIIEAGLDLAEERTS
ncbi:MAG TPA: chorismate mutase [Actinopolymorphaceae bacterium]